MSFAFILYVLWVAGAAAIPFAPAAMRPRLRFYALAASALPVVLALVTVGLMPAALALAGVIALFPAPMAAVGRWLVAEIRARVAALRQTHAH